MTLNELIGATIKNTRCSLNIKAEILAQKIESRYPCAII